MNSQGAEYEGEGGGGITINVENFIGAPEWFEEQMKDYDVHIKPAKTRAAGQERRKLSSMAEMR